MKKDIHPRYKEFKIIVGKDTFITRSASKAPEILMDVDFRKHPAWNKSAHNVVNQANEKLRQFNSKYSGMTFGLKKKS